MCGLLPGESTSSRTPLAAIIISVLAWVLFNPGWTAAQESAWRTSRSSSPEATAFWQSFDGRASQFEASSDSKSAQARLPRSSTSPPTRSIQASQPTSPSSSRAGNGVQRVARLDDVDHLDHLDDVDDEPQGSSVAQATLTDQPAPRVVRHAMGAAEPSSSPPRAAVAANPPADASASPMVRLASALMGTGREVQPVQYSDMTVTDLIWSSESYADCYGLRYAPSHWIGVGALGVWVDGFDTPTLLTTSPPGTPRETAGVLGEPGTSILLGQGDVVDGARAGGYVTLGWYFQRMPSWGIEATLQYYGRNTAESQFSGNQYAILARPFTNVEPGFVGQDAELVVFPDQFNGNFTARATSEMLGLEVNLRRALARGCDCRIDFLLGWRFLRLDDDLVLQDFKSALAGSGLPVGTTLDETDIFTTRNDFNGLNLGVAAEASMGRLAAEVSVKVALGNNSTSVSIDGQSQASVPLGNGMTDTAQFPSGLLAQSTNIGDYRYDQFAVIPEVGVRLGYDINGCMRATVGYSFLYWSPVARPGDQIDTDLNLSQLAPGGLVGLERPAFERRDTDLWAHSLQLGLEWRF